jgi:hypothetical protein
VIKGLSNSETGLLNRLKFGASEAATHPILLHAGKLKMYYDSGSIRYISLGNTETIRMIYSAVRDEYWETIEPLISNERIVTTSHSFDIQYSCRYKRVEIDFEAKYHIRGFQDGSFSFEMQGEAKSDFKKNRIGFCVLHPLNEYAGKPVIIGHPDGTETHSEFPLMISPHQPFKNIRSLKAFFSDNNYTVLNFTGDVFETEDQRNWTDGSFKTYCTPLDNPKPAVVKKGEKIYQKVELQVIVNILAEEKNVTGDDIIISLEEEKTFPVPEIGICRTTRTESITDEEIKILSEIPFKGYCVEIYFFKNSWKETLKSAINESKALGYPLECSLILKNGETKYLEDFLAFAAETEFSLSVIYLFGEDSHTLNIEFVNLAVVLLKKRFPETLIGCGTNANFAQLNRERPVGVNCDFISFSIHPQEHAFDNLSLIENAEAQKYAVRSALSFSGGLPVYASPVTLKRRFNANKEFYEPTTTAANSQSRVDPRQSSLFAASWTLASLKYLAEAGAKSVTFYETVGERGIIQGDFPAIFSEGKTLKTGTIFPVYILLKFILNLPNSTFVKANSSRSLEVDVVCMKSDKTIYLLVFNYHDSSKPVKLSAIDFNLEYLIIDVNLYRTQMFQSNWIEKMKYEKLQESGQLNLLPNSIAIFRSY